MMFVTGTMLNSSQDYSVLSPGVDEGAQSVQANHLAPDQPQHWQVSWNEVRLRTQSSLLQTHASNNLEGVRRNNTHQVKTPPLAVWRSQQQKTTGTWKAIPWQAAWSPAGGSVRQSELSCLILTLLPGAPHSCKVFCLGKQVTVAGRASCQVKLFQFS